MVQQFCNPDPATCPKLRGQGNSRTMVGSEDTNRFIEETFEHLCLIFFILLFPSPKQNKKIILKPISLFEEKKALNICYYYYF